MPTAPDNYSIFLLHCQRINFHKPAWPSRVEWTPKRHNDPDEVSNCQDPLHGGRDFVLVIMPFWGHVGVHSTLDGHGGLWKVLQIRFFGSGNENIV